MEFIKKNYEKLVLGLVLLLLAAAAVFTIFYISKHKEDMQEAREKVSNPKIKELPPVDTSEPDAAYLRTQYAFTLDFTTNHNLFNPVVWKKTPEGTLIKTVTGNEEGPHALVITNIKSLYVIVSYNSPSANGYLVNIERQAQLRESKRRTQNFISRQTKSDLLTLDDVKGAPEKPSELDLEWNETGEKFSISPDKAFQKVDGYSVDLKYPPENKSWTDCRVGGKPLYFDNGIYNIVAITESNIVVSAQPNNKKTTISFSPRN